MGRPVNRGLLRILGITVLAFSPVFFARFVLFDDDLHIFRNSNLALPLLDSLKAIWVESYRGFYIPVTYSIWTVVTSATKTLTGITSLEALSAFPFHLLNLSFHLLNAALVFRITKRFIPEQKAVVWSVLLFAVHPLQVESVAWATGFKDVCCTFFSLCTLDCYFHYLETKGRHLLLLSVATFLLALLSKPSAVVLVVLVPLITAAFRPKDLKSSCVLAATLLFVALPTSIMTSRLQPQSLLLDYTPLYLRPIVAADALLFYLQKLVLPFPLIQDYSRNPADVLKGAGYLTALTLLLLAVFLYKKNLKSLYIGLAAFALSLSPVLGLVPFSFQNFSTVADHYAYFPIAILSIFVAQMLRLYDISVRLKYALTGLFLVMTFFLSTRWTETKRLFHYTLAINPQSIIAHNNLAVAYETDGDLETSLQHYRTAASINPRLNHHHYNVGNTLLKMGRIAEAEQAFRETLVVDPQYAEAYFSLGLIHEASNALDLALDYFEKAQALDPMMGKAGIKKGTILVKQGKEDAGIHEILTAIESDPRTTGQGYFHLGRAYMAKKDYLRAKEAFQKCLTVIPHHEGAGEALAKLEK